jgi:hypothetical protein
MFDIFRLSMRVEARESERTRTTSKKPGSGKRLKWKRGTWKVNG